MSPPSRKIVFHVPSLMPEDTARGRTDAPGEQPLPAAGAPAAPAELPVDGGGEVRKLATLLEVSQALAGNLNLQTGLYGVLEVLERRCGTRRGAITLLEEASGHLVVEAAVGYPRTAARVRYRVGEGITGTVAQRGTPTVVPHLIEEPGFLHRAVSRDARRDEEDMSFLCVPILMEGSSAGTLAVEMPFMPEWDAERMVKVLRIAAAMVSQAVRIHRLVEGERQRLVEENTQLREELRERYELTNIIGNSGPMRRVYEQVAQVVGTNATVMIRGESGTGKELIAHALHHHSPRAGKPFIRVNCAALPETLVETELFGHERGAFTGAQARRKGKFEQADGGTLFLDEIGELSPPPRPSCSACCRAASSSGWAATRRSGWTSG